MNTLLQDLRYGLRVLLKRPGFALVTVLTLALGVGANTAIFSVVNGTLLKPLPYRDAERVVTVWQNDLQAGKDRDDASPANFADWRERARSFEELAAVEPYGHNLTGQGEPEAFQSWLASEGFFRVMGAEALHGRTFTAEEHAPGAPPAVVLSHGLWQRRFGGDTGLVGRALLLNGRPHTVVGVMPPEFDFPEGELWAARAVTERERRDRGSAYWRVVGRLRPGVTVEEARAEMDTIAAQLAAEYPETNGAIRATVVPLREQLTGHIRPALLVLLAAVGLVLLVACANVANLLLARGVERRREFAVRHALGAARSRLARQLLTESFVLALAGGAGGVLLSRWLVDLILAFAPEGLLGAGRLGLDWRVASFAVGATALTAVLFGLLPSLQFSRPDLAGALKETQRTAAGVGAAGRRARDLLVVAEIATALVLLVGAGLLVRSFVELLRVDPGFAADRVAALEVHVWGKYRTPDQRRNFFNEAVERLRALPGVEGAGAVSSLPFVAMDSNTPFEIEGRPAPPAGEGPSAYAITATHDYFGAMNIPLRAGRPFSPADREDTTPVVLVNETMARRHWPGESAVGQKISFGEGEERLTFEIVGVVGDVRHDGLDSAPRAEFFMTHGQDASGSMLFVVRTKGDPQSILQAAKREVWAVNKDIAFSRAVTMNQLVSKSLGERRFTLLLLASFAALALVLAAVGIYGLVSFTTGQRTHEIGVRVALGAQPRDIAAMILKDALWLALAGVGAGVLAALALTRFLRGMLYGVSATDPATYALPALLLCLVALAACYLPARRATKIDPMEALRYE